MSLGMQEILPDGGLASFQHEVSKLADLGRYEDAYIVHAAEGETIVPMAVFDENPRLKAMLFAQMRGMGIDPQQYIVGNELNSINPVTGQPEFFLKKIFKGAKKALKAISPYAGLIAGAFGAGPYWSALAGGIGGLYGSEGDIGAGVSGAMMGYGAGKTFGTSSWVPGTSAADANYVFGNQYGTGMDRFTGSLGRMGTNIGFGGQPGTTQTTSIPSTSGGQTTKALQKLTVPQIEAVNTMPNVSLSEGATFGDLYKLGTIQSPAAPADWYAKAMMTMTLAGVAGEMMFGEDDDPYVDPNPHTYVPWGGNFAAPGVTYANGGIIQKFDNGGEVDPVEIKNLMENYEMTYQEAKEYLDSIKDMNTGGIISAYDNGGPVDRHPGTGINDFSGVKGIPTDDQNIPYDEMMNKQMMKFLIEEFKQGPTDFERKYGNEVAETIRRMMGVTTKEDLIRDQGAVFGDDSSEIVGYNIANGGIIDLDREYTQDKYADGGIAHLAGGSFPRMSGAIAGPGGPKDDMVPAMLSDGEFVMTADAVRNAGGGNRREGARRMYQLMNQLQGAA